MPDRDLTNEEYTFISRALDIITRGPSAEATRMFNALLDMGCTEQWIVEQITFGVAPVASSHVFA